MFDRDELNKFGRDSSRVTNSHFFPSWLSAILLGLFIGGCVQGGCSARAGFRGIFDPIVQAWREASR